jgi:hypothetical protein
MKKSLLFAASFSAIAFAGYSQGNILSTNATAEQVMQGNYTPSTYQASNVIDDPATIAQEISSRISPDSLHAYLEGLRVFQNRNTGSDTVSNTKGIGAARRWIYSKFQQFSAANENRLIPSFLQFDYNVCSMLQHKNVFAVLPGTDLSDKSIVIVEAHMDSRCADNCDTACLAEGMEDNGSGTALVMELARVMSKYSFKHTIVFTTVTGEEQGLVGAGAFATYCKNKGIKIKAVLNNDVVGGIMCGATSSPPGCPGHNSIDSTHVRFFSFGGFNSPHKQLSRFIKLQYKEMALQHATVPMGIHIMSAEDRTGRGGDHIPFRSNNFTAMRVTCANEHGDADVSKPGYADRQHTSGDILGVDTDADMQIDSFFVDFNYLSRNAVINGNALAMAALGSVTPDFYLTSPAPGKVKVHITDQQQYQHFRVGVRMNSNNDWDTVYAFTGATEFTFDVNKDSSYAISVASVDGKGVESLFSKELMINTEVKDATAAYPGVELMQNRPNPFDEKTIISVLVTKQLAPKKAFISIADVAGKEIKRLDIQLKEGVNEVLYEHGYNASGSFTYTLVIDGKPTESKRMIFAN